MNAGRAIRAVVAAYHYSRLSVGVAAGVMTAATSMVLLGAVRIDAVLLVGLGGLAAYWFDDLVDVGRDEKREPSLRRTRSVRVALRVIGIGLVLAYAVGVLRREPAGLLVLLAVVGALSAGYCLRHVLRGKHGPSAMRHGIQALGWSAGCVLGPQAAANADTTAQSWMAFGFFFLLMVPVIDLWQHSSAQPPQRVRRLVILCGISASLAVIGVAFQWFPWWNLALLAAPAANLMFLWIRQLALIRNPAIFTELAVAFNTLCGLLVLGAYRSGLRPQDVGPRLVLDYVQMAAVITLLGLLGGNLWLRQSQGLHPVRAEGTSAAVVILGLAVFAFQELQSSFHLQSWLFPWLNTWLFDAGPLRIPGAAAVFGAMLLLGGGYRQMGSSWRIGIDERTPGELVTSGLFRRSRNPIYLAIELFMVGTFLMNPTPMTLLYAAVTPLFLDSQIRREECFLAGKYGSKYDQYAARTPRYF